MPPARALPGERVDVSGARRPAAQPVEVDRLRPRARARAPHAERRRAVDVMFVHPDHDADSVQLLAEIAELCGDMFAAQGDAELAAHEYGAAAELAIEAEQR